MQKIDLYEYVVVGAEHTCRFPPAILMVTSNTSTIDKGAFTRFDRYVTALMAVLHVSYKVIPT